MYVAQYRPDGNLCDMTLADIEMVSEWPGEPGKFISALIEVKLIDQVNGIYSIHDWVEHNPWAASAPQRKLAAQNAANAKWKKSCKGMRRAQKRICPLPIPSLPIPSLPEDQKPLFPEQTGNGNLFEKWWKTYPNKNDKKKARERWSKINPSPELVETMIKATQAQKEWRETAGPKEFRPEWKLGSTWLNGECWNNPTDNSDSTNDWWIRSLPMRKG
jgi:hypothetical protein